MSNIKVPGLGDVFSKPVSDIVSASPGILATSRNTDDAKQRLQNALENSREKAQANLQGYAIDKALALGDKYAPSLSLLARSALGRQLSDVRLPPSDPPMDPNGWYAKALNRNDPMLVLDWDIDMPRIGNYQLPSSYVEEINPNFISYNDYRVFLAGKQEVFASFMNISGLSVALYEDNILSATSYIDHWLRKVRNFDGTFNAPDDYQKRIIWYLVAYANGKPVRVGQFNFERCFPMSMSNLMGSSGSSERQRVMVEFGCSDAIFIPYSEDVASSVSKARASVQAQATGPAGQGNDKLSFGDVWRSIRNEGPIDAAKKMIPKEYKSLGGVKNLAVTQLEKNVRNSLSALPTQVRL